MFVVLTPTFCLPCSEMCDSVEAAFNSAWREAGLPPDVAPGEAPTAPAASTGGASKQSKKGKKKAASSDSDDDIPSPARKRRKPAGKPRMPEARGTHLDLAGPDTR